MDPKYHKFKIWCLLSFPVYFTEKLSPDQIAPLFARGSGGLILKPPFESEPKGAASPPASTNIVNEDGVERKETATFKLVDGELVRVVEGSFAYKSPEGIPVSVQLGAAATGETRPLIRPPGPKIVPTNVDRSYLPPQ
ncbi:hypothetical protein EAG_02383 [Camponotus floridanus]|uniref:Uncharacterized protein n=1 Tax=Camponotus floridanus TaxID=104421 RepID=E2ASM4_CAMFO|nr:hypothetical protein EAG_02383 [Camponotus floridanus]